jgi:hypothetical protein
MLSAGVDAQRKRRPQTGIVFGLWRSTNRAQNFGSVFSVLRWQPAHLGSITVDAPRLPHCRHLTVFRMEGIQPKITVQHVLAFK